MKKITWIILLFLSQLNFAQKIQEKSLLWEISGKNLTKPSYIFGTMHVMCQGDVVLTPEIEKSLQSSDQIMMELDMDDPMIMFNMMGATLSKDGKTLTEKLGEDLSKKVDAILQERAKISLAMLDNLNLQALSMQLGLLGLSCPMELGYDMLLTQEAQKNGKEIFGLETVEEQLKVLMEQSDEETLKAISFMANNFSEVEKELMTMVETYKARDVQKLYDIVFESYKDPKYPQVKLEELLDNRNKNWIPILENAMKDKSLFIAVGAAHLAGENGVINLLRKQGYTVKAMQ